MRTGNLEGGLPSIFQRHCFCVRSCHDPNSSGLALPHIISNLVDELLLYLPPHFILGCPGVDDKRFGRMRPFRRRAINKPKNAGANIGRHVLYIFFVHNFTVAHQNLIHLTIVAANGSFKQRLFNISVATPPAKHARSKKIIVLGLPLTDRADRDPEPSRPNQQHPRRPRASFWRLHNIPAGRRRNCHYAGPRNWGLFASMLSCASC